MQQKALYFGAEHEGASHLRIVHRLDSEKVARSEKLLCILVPYYKGKHSSQPVKKSFLPLLISVEQNLGVGVGFKNVPVRYKLLAKFAIIVYLSVKK